MKYNVEGSYGFFDFDVNLRNFKRTTSGGLFVEAQPNNSMVQGIVSKLVPKEDLTKDGWIKSFVPKAKIDSAIALLKANNGQSAEIDAGQGVTLNLTLAK